MNSIVSKKKKCHENKFNNFFRLLYGKSTLETFADFRVLSIRKCSVFNSAKNLCGLFSEIKCIFVKIQFSEYTLSQIE